MKEIELLCTKKVHFTFTGNTYIQTEGVAIGSPLGPVLVDIFMVELVKLLLLKLTSYISYWKRYVNKPRLFHQNRICRVQLSVLNGFDNSIEFTVEFTEFTVEEKNYGVLLFLDVLICRNDS